MNGNITGTNDLKIAASCAFSEDDFVLDSETGEWLIAPKDDGDIPARVEIKDIGEE